MVLKLISRIRHSSNCLILFFIFSCTGIQNSNKESVSLIWRNNRPVALAIPKNYFSQVAGDSVKYLLTIHLVNGKDTPAMWGEYVLLEDEVRFEPLIPFTQNARYEVKLRNKPVAGITIPNVDNADAPELLAVFPSQDTLPQNLLKFYFRFSTPMREGQSLDHITLLKNGRDTVPKVFLDLQPELWNHDRTLLTVWLDPGRIKRDLQPHKKLGEPLEKGDQYQLVVSNSWTDSHNTSLLQEYRKGFTVSLRDSLSPAPEQWAVVVPDAGSKDPVEINFRENLDYVLVNEAIRIVNEEGKNIDGKIELSREESILHFMPHLPWTAGVYTIRCEGRLEDLAGNNLNRLFDRDISQSLEKPGHDFFSRKFTIN